MKVDSEQVAGTKLVAAALRESIRRGRPGEPDWFSLVILLADRFHTSEQYQVWLAVREIVAERADG